MGKVVQKTSDVVLGFSHWLSYRTQFQSLFLSLALMAWSSVLSLSFKV